MYNPPRPTIPPSSWRSKVDTHGQSRMRTRNPTAANSLLNPPPHHQHHQHHHPSSKTELHELNLHGWCCFCKCSLTWMNGIRWQVEKPTFFFFFFRHTSAAASSASGTRNKIWSNSDSTLLLILRALHERLLSRALSLSPSLFLF